jgi:hypothetical protein
MATEDDILEDEASGKIDDSIEHDESPTIEKDGIEYNSDGSAILHLSKEFVEKKDADFYENLAESIPADVLQSLGTMLVEVVERDIQDRKPREDQYEEGIKRTDLGREAPGGAGFTGASRAAHPMITEAAIDFEARAIKELFPAGGPAKADESSEDPVKIDKAKKKADFLNWQFTKQMPEFRPGLERNLMQLSLSGDGYIKFYPDPRLKRTKSECVTSDKLVLASSADSFEECQRKTHLLDLSKIEYDRRVQSGMYIDDGSFVGGLTPEPGKAEKARDKVEGVEVDPYNQDGLRLVYESHIHLLIEEDDKRKDDKGVAPYILTVDKTTGKVLSLRRNWDEEDETEEELQWFAPFGFVPWSGALHMGFPHLIGGLSAAATGALRALLDSGHINNFPGMLKLKGATGGGSMKIEPTQVTEIDGGPTATDIRQIAMPIPFNEPSNMLFQLLGFTVDAGKGVVRTTLDEAQDNTNVPVGTTMARIEEGMVVFSAIHARLHRAMQSCLSIMHRINATYLDEESVNKQYTKHKITRELFKGPLDTLPVSDPDIYSELQRGAQVNMIAQRAAANPAEYDSRKVEEFILETTKIPNAKSLLVAKPEPVQMNAVNENVAAGLGRPVVAFPTQDDTAHIHVHLAFLEDPLFGANPLIAPNALRGLMQHLPEHLLFWYAKKHHQVASEAAGEDISQHMTELQATGEFDRLMAAATGKVLQAAEKEFAGISQRIQTLVQQMQQYQPPPQMDPGQAQVKAAQEESQAKQADTQAKVQIGMANVQAKQADTAQRDQQAAADRAAALQKAQLDNQTKQQTAQEAAAAAGSRQQHGDDTKLQVTQMDNQTAEAIVAFEAQVGHKTNITNGSAVGKSHLSP